MFIFGGRDRVANFQDIHAFDFESRAWRRIECEGIEGRFFCSAVLMDSRMHVFGGRNIHSFAFNDTLRYDIHDARDESLLEDMQLLVGDPEFADVVFVMPDDDSPDADGAAAALAVEEPEGDCVAARPRTHSKVPPPAHLEIPPHLASCKRIFAHREIVARRSPALAIMLGSGMLEGRTGVVPLRDTTAAAVRGLLVYLYTDAVLETNPRELARLLALANQWQLAHLKYECQRLLVRGISLHNSLDLLKLSHQLDATLLFDACRSFINKNLAVIPPAQWDSLPVVLAAAVQYVASPPPPRKEPRGP